MANTSLERAAFLMLHTFWRMINSLDRATVRTRNSAPGLVDLGHHADEPLKFFSFTALHDNTSSPARLEAA